MDSSNFPDRGYANWPLISCFLSASLNKGVTFAVFQSVGALPESNPCHNNQELFQLLCPELTPPLCLAETSWQTLRGQTWKKVAIGSLTIAAVCAVIAVVLHSQEVRMKKELLSKKVALDSAVIRYNEASDSIGREVTQSECARYEDTFLNWLQTFCKIVNCTSELCHKYWTPYKGNCYFFSRTILGWEDSRQNCIAQGSELLVIHSEEEQEFVAGFNASRIYWIGIKDNPLEATWMWVDGTTLQEDLIFWDRDNPDSYFDYDLEAFKNCVFLRSGAWANAVCTIPHYWICKRRSEPPPIKL
ncbi:CD209 antigen-like protein C [Heterodontus francisci]|uniref:CD209 antigen-like protein C n=1 Tax=Heterodontus francisci TaxID=7792 RepID=UPI00355AD0DE